MKELLPHEADTLRALLDKGLQENERAAVDMSAAASDTNSWHDNAEYDEAIERMKLIDARYTPLMKILGSMTVLEYPDAEDKRVRLGSLAYVNFGDDTQPVLVVGLRLDSEALYQDAWKREGNEEDLMVVTSESPLGTVLLGIESGNQVILHVGTASSELVVNDIDQAWISQFKPEDS